jgi:hypothetical protein
MVDMDDQIQRHAAQGPEHEDSGECGGPSVGARPRLGGDAVAQAPGDVAAALDRLGDAAEAHDQDYQDYAPPRPD